MNDILIFLVIFFGFFVLLGVVFFLIGIITLNNRKKKEMNCTSKTYGKVIDIISHLRHTTDGGYTSSWHPVFEYNIGELKFIKESAYGNSQSQYAIGQDIEIYYNPNDYNEYYISGDTISKTIAIIFTSIGIVSIIIAIFSAVLLLSCI